MFLEGRQPDQSTTLGQPSLLSQKREAVSETQLCEWPSGGGGTESEEEYKGCTQGKENKDGTKSTITLVEQILTELVPLLFFHIHPQKAGCSFCLQGSLLLAYSPSLAAKSKIPIFTVSNVTLLWPLFPKPVIGSLHPDPAVFSLLQDPWESLSCLDASSRSWGWHVGIILLAAGASWSNNSSRARNQETHYYITSFAHLGSTALAREGWFPGWLTIRELSKLYRILLSPTTLCKLS